MFISVPLLITGVSAHLISIAVEVCMEKLLQRSYAKVAGESASLTRADLAEIQAAVREEYAASSPPVNLVPEHCAHCGAPLKEGDIRGLSIVCTFCNSETRLEFSSREDLRAWLGAHGERKESVDLAEEIESRVVGELGEGVLAKSLDELPPGERERFDTAVQGVLADNGIDPGTTAAAISGLAEGTARPRSPGVLDELGNLLVIGAAGAADTTSALVERIERAYTSLSAGHARLEGELAVLVDKGLEAEAKGVPQDVLDGHVKRIKGLRKFHGRLGDGLRDVGVLKDRGDISDPEKEKALRALMLILADAGAMEKEIIARERARLAKINSVTSTERWAQGLVQPEGASSWTKTSSVGKTEDMFR